FLADAEGASTANGSWLLLLSAGRRFLLDAQVAQALGEAGAGFGLGGAAIGELGRELLGPARGLGEPLDELLLQGGGARGLLDRPDALAELGAPLGGVVELGPERLDLAVDLAEL